MTSADELRSEVREGLEAEIHELCQPLTTLRCRLELAMMYDDPAHAGSEHLREAVTGSLMDMKRVFASVGRLRHLLIAERPK